MQSNTLKNQAIPKYVSSSTSILGCLVACLFVLTSCSLFGNNSVLDSSGEFPIVNPGSSIEEAVEALGAEASIVAFTQDGVDTVISYEEPNESSNQINTFDNPLVVGENNTSSRLVFRVLEQEGAWLKVMLPMQPNGSVGWIKSNTADLFTSTYRIFVDTKTHVLAVYKNGKFFLDSPAAIGIEGETPTPFGSFYLAQKFQTTQQDSPYGPFAFGLSGFSQVLESFAGGEPIVGIHGTNQPELLGQDASSGCVRVSNEIITQMKDEIPLGTPVEIF